MQAQVLAGNAWQSLLNDTDLRSIVQAVLGDGPLTPAGGVVRTLLPHAPQTTPPHQDAAYLGAAEPVWMLWLPLAPCGLNDGVLAAVPGSHLGGLRPHFAAADGPSAAVVQATDRWHASPLKPGDVLLLSAMTLHGSLPNQGPLLRMSVDLRWRGQPRRQFEPSENMPILRTVEISETPT